MSVFAVIDTNVVVAALRTKHDDAATALVLNAIVEKQVVPLFSPEIIDEYRDVLGRPKFGFDPVKVEKVINLFTSVGECVEPLGSGAVMPDEDDRVFYEVTLSKEGAKLVTGNAKHFPKSERVVTPSEFLEILDSAGTDPAKRP